MTESNLIHQVLTNYLLEDPDFDPKSKKLLSLEYKVLSRDTAFYLEIDTTKSNQLSLENDSLIKKGIEA